MQLFFHLNTVNAAPFLVECREHYFFSAQTPLTPLFILLSAVNAVSISVERS